MIKPRQRSKREPTIALINIVFLMLVFFLQYIVILLSSLLLFLKFF